MAIFQNSYEAIAMSHLFISPKKTYPRTSKSNCCFNLEI